MEEPKLSADDVAAVIETYERLRTHAGLSQEEAKRETLEAFANRATYERPRRGTVRGRGPVLLRFSGSGDRHKTRSRLQALERGAVIGNHGQAPPSGPIRVYIVVLADVYRGPQYGWTQEMD